MEKQNSSNADHQILESFPDSIETPGTPTKKVLPYKARNLSSTSLNFVMTPTRLTNSGASLVTLGGSQEIDPEMNDYRSPMAKPILFTSPRISSPIEDSKNVMLPPMTPKTHMDEMVLSPSPTLLSPKMNRRRHQSLPLRMPQFINNEMDNDLNCDDHELPCRPISKGLKTRLNCALMNLQNGWFEKSLPELETGLCSRGKHCRDDLDSSPSSPTTFFDTLDNQKRARCDFNLLNVSPKNDNHSPKQTITQKKRC